MVCLSSWVVAMVCCNKQDRTIFMALIIFGNLASKSSRPFRRPYNHYDNTSSKSTKFEYQSFIFLHIICFIHSSILSLVNYLIPGQKISSIFLLPSHLTGLQLSNMVSRWVRKNPFCLLFL